jgi:MFS transporter, DHA1 family, tetracycline resistance protein
LSAGSFTGLKMKKSPLASILSIVFTDLLGFGMIIPVLPLYAQRFHASEWQIGLLLASFSAIQFLASPILGWVSDHFGRRPVLFYSLIGSATGYLVMASARTLEMLFLARILAGLGGATVGTVTAYIADITPPEHRSKRNALIGASYGIGFVLGPAVGGFLSQWSVTAPFWFAAILSILNAIWMWIALPETGKHAAPQTGRGDLRQAFKQAGGWRLGIVVVTKFIGSAGFALWTAILPQVLFRRFGLDQSQISFVFGAGGLLGAAIQVGVFGQLARRFGDVDLQIAGFAITAISMMIMPFAGSVPLFLVFGAGFMVGNSVSLPIPGAMASKGAGAAMQGRVLGIVDSAGCLGRVFGPVLAGFLLTADHARSNAQYGNSPFLACGAIVAIGSVLTATLRRSEPKSIAPSRILTNEK